MTKIDSALVLRSIGALVGLAGVVGIPLWAGTDTLEAKVAFWTVWPTFIIMGVYSAAPLTAGPIRSWKRSRENDRLWRDARADFPAWRTRWDKLDRLIRKAVEEYAGGELSQSTVRTYKQLRQEFQINQPSFLPHLEYAVSDRLMDTVARSDNHRFNLDRYMASAAHPFRLFYSETDLVKLVQGICPALRDSWYGRQQDMENLNRTLERIQDIIREFAAERSLPY